MTEKEIYGFKCPMCQNCKLEEVLVNAVVSQVVYAVSEDSVFYHDEDKCGIIDGIPGRYQCGECGWVLKDIISAYDLFYFLKEQHEKESDI